MADFKPPVHRVMALVIIPNLPFLKKVFCHPLLSDETFLYSCKRIFIVDLNAYSYISSCAIKNCRISYAVFILVLHCF